LADADQLLLLDRWPLEGRTLGAIIQQLISPASWSVLTELTGEHLPPRLKAMAKLGLVRLVELDWQVEPDEPSERPEVEAIKACQPLLEHWNSGALIAKGRRGDPLTLPVEIPPPSASWELWVADFSRSIVEDPRRVGDEIYDLRFFPKPKPDPEPKATTANKSWIATEAKRMKAAGEINGSTRITSFAKQLEARLKEESKAGDKSLKPVTWQYIKNMLPAWGLWPIDSIK
jgi:hypothetical protein